MGRVIGSVVMTGLAVYVAFTISAWGWLFVVVFAGLTYSSWVRSRGEALERVIMDNAERYGVSPDDED